MCTHDALTFSGRCTLCGENVYRLGVCEWCHSNPVETVTEIDGSTLAVCQWCLTE